MDVRQTINIEFYPTLYCFGMFSLQRQSTNSLTVCFSAEESMKTPVYTFACGVTNSMRGAAFLSGENIP